MKAEALNYTNPEAQKWIDHQIVKITKEYIAEGAEQEQIDMAVQNAEQLAGNDTTAREWVETFEASIF